MKQITLTLEQIANEAGFFKGADGRLNLPNENEKEAQQTADAIARATEKLLGGEWKPGDEPGPDIILTGGGPIWAYLKIQHALHGRTKRLVYASPNATIVIYNHGITDKE